MSKLTLLSKILIIGIPSIILVMMVSMCISCSNGCNRQPNQVYYQDSQPVYEQSQPSVVYVQQPDGSSVLMNYLLWKSLMDQGGQTRVNNYYYQHRNEPEFQSQRQQEYRQTYEHEKVQTQKSQGFGSKPVETKTSNGFGSKPVDTKKSNGFGSSWPSPTTSSSGPSTSSRSNGFGSSSSSNSFKSNPSVVTKSSSGFGSRSSNSVSTSKSSGFGKKQ